MSGSVNYAGHVFVVDCWRGFKAVQVRQDGKIG